MNRPKIGSVEERTAPDATVDGKRLRGLIPYGVESRDMGGWREVIEPGALAGAKLDDLVATVDHVGIPIGRYPTTLDLEDRADGAHWSVQLLAQGHQDRLQHELADLTRGLTLRWVPAREQTEPSPVEIKLNTLRWELRQWALVAARAGEFAANEAHGWTIMADGTCAKVLDNGKVLSAWGGVSYEEDGEIVDTSKRSDQWHKRHRTVTRQFGTRVRDERLTNARSRTRPAVGQQRAREHRPAATRRANSSSSTSSADPGDPEPEPPAPLRLAPAPRAVLTFALLTAAERGEVAS